MPWIVTRKDVIENIIGRKLEFKREECMLDAEELTKKQTITKSV